MPTDSFIICFGNTDCEEKFGRFLSILTKSLSKLNDGNRQPVLCLLARISNIIGKFVTHFLCQMLSKLSSQNFSHKFDTNI